MSIVSAKCTNCGAALKVDNAKEAAVCEFCGTPFIVEKAINNYTISNHIQAQVVNVYGSAAQDFDIRGGVLQKYNGNGTDIEIPENLNIVEIGDDAFKNCVGIKKIVIPSGVRKIGYLAFYGCTNMESISIPKTVNAIGQRAFEGCKSLKKVVLPSDVKSLEIGLFDGCTGLEEVTISPEITSLRGFSGCRSLRKISNGTAIPSEYEPLLKSLRTPLIIPESISCIESGAFNSLQGISDVVILNPFCELKGSSFSNMFTTIHISTHEFNRLEEFFEAGAEAYNSGHEFWPQITKGIISNMFFSERDSFKVKDLSVLRYGYVIDFDKYKNAAPITLKNLDIELSAISHGTNYVSELLKAQNEQRIKEAEKREKNRVKKRSPGKMIAGALIVFWFGIALAGAISVPKEGGEFVEGVPQIFTVVFLGIVVLIGLILFFSGLRKK